MKLLKLWALNVSMSSIIISIVQIIRSSEQEVWDQLIYLSVATVSFLIFLSTLKRNIIELNSYLVTLLGLPLLLLGIFGTEIHGTETTGGINVTGLLWLGFGTWVLITAIFLIPFIFAIYEWHTLPKTVKYALSFFAIATSLSSLPAAWQGGNSIIDTFHAEYVINETLSVSAGQLPYVDFIPQYGTFFSWLIAPFKLFLNADSLVTLSLYLLSFITIITIIMGVHLVYMGTNKNSIVISILTVVPLTNIAHFPDRDVFTGTIHALLSQIPIRLFWVLFIFLFLISFLTQEKPKKLNGFLVGLFSGASLWINQDFTLIGGLLAMVFICFLVKTKQGILVAFFGYLAGISLYPLITLFLGRTIRLEYIGYFNTQYGNGFMAEPITTPGPVLVILPLIASIASISTGLLIRERFLMLPFPPKLKRAIITSSYFSLWSALGFIYYLNRSYASGQLQILFLPISIALGNFIYTIMQLNHKEKRWSTETLLTGTAWQKQEINRTVPQLTLAIVMCLPIASVIAFPNPLIEINRLTQSVDSHTWPKPDSKSVIETISRLRKTANFPLSETSYFGGSGNYIKLKTNISSVNIFNNPMDIHTQKTFNTGCRPIIESRSKFLILGSEARLIFNSDNSSICGVYEYVNLQGMDEYRVAKRIR
jgi:hypothetical protein